MTNKTTQEKFNDLQPWGIQNLRTSAEGCFIVFIKKDGTEREMRCTLNPSLIPQEKQPKLTESEESSSTAGSPIRVFDLDKQEWRSFRWDSVKQFTL
jgi:hypothetical protein